MVEEPPIVKNVSMGEKIPIAKNVSMVENIPNWKCPNHW